VAMCPIGTLCMAAYNFRVGKLATDGPERSKFLEQLSSQQQWLDLVVLTFFSRSKVGTEGILLTCCIALKMLTWCIPLMLRAAANLQINKHDDTVRDESKGPNMPCCCQCSNLTIPFRIILDLYFGGSWMSAWALMMWITTPYRDADMVDNNKELAEVQDSDTPYYKVRSNTNLIRWRKLTLFARFVLWLFQAILLSREMSEDYDKPWLKYFSAVALLFYAMSGRADLMLLLEIKHKTDDLKTWWKHLPMLSSVITCFFLSLEMLIHAWYAYVDEALNSRLDVHVDVNESHLFASVTIMWMVIFPGMLHSPGKPFTCLTDHLPDAMREDPDTWRSFLAWPFQAATGACAFHTLIELADVVSFICILKTMNPMNVETKIWRYLGWDVDIRYLMYIFLAEQLIIWLLLIAWYMHRPIWKPDSYQKFVLKLSLAVEVMTDVPELFFLFVWGGWRGGGAEGVILIIIMVADVILTIKSAIFNPLYYMCTKTTPGTPGPTGSPGRSGNTDTTATTAPTTAPTNYKDDEASFSV